MSLSLRSVRIPELNDSLQNRWRGIQQVNSDWLSPLLGPDYAVLVGTHRRDSRVAIIEQDDQPVGFLPYHDLGRGKAIPIGGQLSDLQAIVTQPGISVDANWFMRNLGLRVLHFDHLLTNQEHFANHIRMVDDAAVIDINEDTKRYFHWLEQNSKSFWKQMNRKRRQLARDIGPLRFELHCADATLLQSSIDWKQQQLKQQGLQDSLREQWVRDLAHSMQIHLSDSTRGLLSTLWAGDTPVATHLGLLGNGILNSWIPAHNIKLAKYSPGALLHLDLIAEAPRLGIRRIDLGRGVNRLKSRLMTRAIPLGIGSIDLRRFSRLGTSLWYQCRQLADSHPMLERALAIYRRLRYQT